MGLSCEIDGNDLFKGSLTVDDVAPIRGVIQLLDFLETARLVCRHLDVDPLLPAWELLEQDEGLVRGLKELIESGPLTQSVSTCLAKVEFRSVQTARALLSETYPSEHPGFCHAGEAQVHSIFGGDARWLADSKASDSTSTHERVQGNPGDVD